MKGELFVMENLYELLQIPVSSTDYEIYHAFWKLLSFNRNENSEIRLFQNCKIISTNYDYLNSYIDKYYDKNNIRRTVAALMCNDFENNLSSDIYNFLIERKQI